MTIAHKEAGLTVRFWGVRGSTATPGTTFAAVGGNTSCVEVHAGNETIVLDAGTGLVPLARAWGARTSATFLISHYHWDHIQGFPFFTPAYMADNRFVLYGPGLGRRGIRASLGRLMQAPHFPVRLSTMRAHLDFRSISPGDEVSVGPVRIRAAALHHPQGCLGYRITVGNAVLVYATDTEPLAVGVVDPAVVNLARGADLLIHDAQYTDDEYEGLCGPCRHGWGHTTVAAACRLACAAGVKQLALFHHDPVHDDAMIEQFEQRARALMPNTIAAREGMVLTLAGTEAVRNQVRQDRFTAEDLWPTAAVS